MRIVISDFMSLDGVVQAPGGRDEDTEGGFAHGGWSIRYFDPAAMGPLLGDVMERTDRCSSVVVHGRRWRPRGRAVPQIPSPTA